tara:strand:- start:6163 stop:7233 length:1071 start_codon:yes stop_codon:yes gene_type:complete
MTRNVHIEGTGTIGSPLINMLAKLRLPLYIDKVTFNKNTPLKTDRSRVWKLIDAGAKLCTYEDRIDKFRELGMNPAMSAEEAREEADVIIDCTPFGNKNKEIYAALQKPKGIIAQGSEKGFGVPYVRAINDSALDGRFTQVVSCNTHNIAALVNCFGFKNGEEPDNFVRGRMNCIRRANDLSQDDKFVPSPTVDGFKDEVYGTHHAKDAHDLFATLDYDIDLFSSSLKTNTQLMHLVDFDITVREKTTVTDLQKLIYKNKYVAHTFKKSANQVFHFGREFGWNGRILNHTVIPHEKLNVKETGESYLISGHSFTPQDGNSLLSSVAATLWYLDESSGKKEYGELLQNFKDYVFSEI